MPDPLHTLPNELWTLCVKIAIDGRSNGPLELIKVSKHWETLLISSPSLWTQIHLHNGEDEIARISTFLCLSRDSPLHLDIMAILPEMDGLRVIAQNVSRVKTVSIRPRAISNAEAILDMTQWKESASYTMATIFDRLPPSYVKNTLCLGMSLPDHGQLHYQIVYMSFIVSDHKQKRIISTASSVASSQTWAESVARCAFIRLLNILIKEEPLIDTNSTLRNSSDQDSLARASSIALIADLASYGK